MAKQEQKTVSIDEIVEHITKLVEQKVLAEVDAKLEDNTAKHKEISTMIDRQINEAAAKVSERVMETSKEVLSFKGGKYKIEVDGDGLMFTRGKDVPLVIGKNGQLGSGIRSPRTVGKGSAHFKAGSPSSAIIPSTGKHSTRGVIVEGDGDDAETYIFRALSKQNRSGFNVFSEGSIALGSMEKVGKSTLGVYHRYNETPGAEIYVASKDFHSAGLNINSNAPMSDFWKAISVRSDVECGDMKSEVFGVTGSGKVQTTGVYATETGYAEMFEWADKNARDENRVGFTVTVNKEGKIRVADEGDEILGVVVPNAAFIGNTAWNYWNEKFLKDNKNQDVTKTYNLVEWLDDDSTTLKSYYADELSADFALPDNAIEIQTDPNGDDMKRKILNRRYKNKLYSGRTERTEWAIVCLFGTAVIYKGQLYRNSWLKIKDISDELELVLIR